MLSLTFLFLYSLFPHSPLSASVLFVLFFTANRLATLLQLLYDSSSYILFNTAILRAHHFRHAASSKKSQQAIDKIPFFAPLPATSRQVVSRALQNGYRKFKQGKTSLAQCLQRLFGSGVTCSNNNKKHLFSQS